MPTLQSLASPFIAVSSKLQSSTIHFFMSVSSVYNAFSIITQNRQKNNVSTDFFLLFREAHSHCQFSAGIFRRDAAVHFLAQLFCYG